MISGHCILLRIENDTAYFSLCLAYTLFITKNFSNERKEETFWDRKMFYICITSFFYNHGLKSEYLRDTFFRN